MARRLLRGLAPSAPIEVARAQRLLVRSGLDQREAWQRAPAANGVRSVSGAVDDRPPSAFRSPELWSRQQRAKRAAADGERRGRR